MTERFKLSSPIHQQGGPNIEEITFRRPKIRDLREINRAAKGGDEVEQLISMIAGCSFLTVEQIEQIDAADMTALAEAIVPFFPTDPGQKTGT